MSPTSPPHKPGGPARLLNALGRTRVGYDLRSRILLALLAAPAAFWAAAEAGNGGPGAGGFQLVHEGFAAFSRGSFENAGENLYVSRKGRMQMIRRWDLNHDGYYELLFATAHNNVPGMVDALAYLQTESGYHTIISPVHATMALYDLWLQEERSRSSTRRFPVDLPSSVLFHDVDSDGIPDVIFSSMGSDGTRRAPSTLFWGTRDGFDTNAPLKLETVAARDVAAGDLNGDGYQDIVFANQDSGGSYIYWGSANRHGAADRTTVATGRAVGCAVGDLDGDDLPELVFACEGGLRVYRGTPSGPDLKTPLESAAVGLQSVRIFGTPDMGVVAACVTASSVSLHTLRAAGLASGRRASVGGTRAAIADLDRDGKSDLVIASGDRSTILWGKSEWSQDVSTLLPTQSARDVTVADLDQDGREEIIFANYSEGTAANLDVTSPIYWGKSWGYGVEARTDLQTFGAEAVAVGDVNRDGRPDVVFGNTGSGIGGGKNEHVFVYWGRAHRGYSPAAMTSFPCVMGMSTATSDLDDDGNVDLLVANSGRHRTGESGGSHLYWGTAAGPSPAHRQDFPTNEVGSWAVADLNRDGWLDAIACDFDALLIAWGGPDRFTSPANRTRIEGVASAAQILRLVDFDRDGWLDIFVADLRGERNRVLLGGPQGYAADRCLWLDDDYVSNAEFADLDRDGYLDMILLRAYVNSGGFIDHNNSWARIRYGGPRGFHERPPVQFPASNAFDVSIADLDGDADLDFAVSQYHSNDRANLPVWIYWNDGAGNFDTRRRTGLPAEGGAGLLAGDFDEDGHTDLLVANHKKTYKAASHTVDSYLYWGSPKGFSVTERLSLPNHGPHWMQVADMGNLMTREPREVYISPAEKIPNSVLKLKLSWKGSTPLGASLEFEARTAATMDALPRARWIRTGQAGEIALTPSESVLQYRVTFCAGRGHATPVLTSVSLREVR